MSNVTFRSTINHLLNLEDTWLSWIYFYQKLSFSQQNAPSYNLFEILLFIPNFCYINSTSHVPASVDFFLGGGRYKVIYYITDEYDKSWHIKQALPGAYLTNNFCKGLRYYWKWMLYMYYAYFIFQLLHRLR